MANERKIQSFELPIQDTADVTEPVESEGVFSVPSNEPRLDSINMEEYIERPAESYEQLMENVPEPAGEEDYENPVFEDEEEDFEEPALEDGEEDYEEPVFEDEEEYYEEPVYEDGEEDYEEPVYEDGEEDYEEPVYEDGEEYYEEPVYEDGEEYYEEPVYEDREENYEERALEDGEEDYEEPDFEDEEEDYEEPVKPAGRQRRPASQLSKRADRQKGGKKKKHVVLPIISGIVLLVLVVLVVIGLSEMTSFKSHGKKMKADLKSVVYCVKDDDFAGAEDAMEEVDKERLYLRNKINDPFWKQVGKIPFFKEDLQSVNDLLDILDDACNQIIRPFIVQTKGHPLSNLKADGGFNVSLIHSYLDFAEMIVPVVDDMAVRINSIEFGPISKGAVGDYSEKIESLIETYEHFKKYIPLVSAFCGNGEDKFYIMLAQNSAEIRASGGFPGSMGTVTIKDGILEIGDFVSVYDLLPMGQAFDSGITDQEIELFGYMYAGESHDACFNPHFARVGEITKASYEEYNPEFVDGIISLTPVVIQDILRFLDASITLEDGSVLDGTNATRVIQRELYIVYQGVEGTAFDNNDFVDSMFAETAKQAMDVLVSNFKLEKLPEYVKLFENGFHNRTIMLWLADPKEERLVEAVGASGNLNYDRNDPKAGIYFSVCDPSKLGMFVEIIPELSEPTRLPDGSNEYTMKVTLNNYLNEYMDKYTIDSWFVLGGYGGSIQSYVYFFAPAGGTVSDFEIDTDNEIVLDEYEKLELGYVLNLFLHPDKPVTVTYKITTAPGVDAPLTIDMTPTLQDYR